VRDFHPRTANKNKWLWAYYTHSLSYYAKV